MLPMGKLRGFDGKLTVNSLTKGRECGIIIMQIVILREICELNYKYKEKAK